MSFIKIGITKIAIAILVIPIFGCSSFFFKESCVDVAPNIAKKGYNREVIKNADWSSEDGNIEINLLAGEKLNVYQGSSHSLLIKVYQLSSKGEFRKMTASANKISKLLSPLYKHSSMVEVEEYILYPGVSDKIKINRAANVKYIGIVAGFYNLVPIRVAYLFFVPVKNFTKWYEVFSSDKWQPQSLSIDLVFGSKNLSVTNYEMCNL